MPHEEIVSQFEGHFEVPVDVLAPARAAVRAKLAWLLQFVNSGRDDTKVRVDGAEDRAGRLLEDC